MAELSFAKEKINIVLLEGVHDSATERFARDGYVNVRRIDEALTGRDLHAAVENAHMIGIRSRTRVTAEALAHAPKVIAIGCFCIGTNQVDLAAAAVRAVPVFNAPHSNTRSVAELVIAEMVMLYRGLGDRNMAAHQGRWTKDARASHELRGSTLGIIGYGHIGSQVSILAEAFGMTVVYHDVVPRLPMGNATQLATLDEVLERSDLVTLHVPQAPDTVNLIGGEQLARMKSGACLLNASRGTVVVIDALVEALDSGHLAGAAIDVFPQEPRSNADPFESPLVGRRNVILTPHIGGSTIEAQRNIGVEVAAKLAAFSDLGSTIGAVNFPNISLAPHEDAHRILHAHHNQPGVLSAVNAVLAESEVNIVGQHLQTTAEVGYVVTDVDRAVPELVDRLRGLPGTIRTRVLF